MHRSIREMLWSCYGTTALICTNVFLFYLTWSPICLSPRPTSSIEVILLIGFRFHWSLVLFCILRHHSFAPIHILFTIQTYMSISIMYIYIYNCWKKSKLKSYWSYIWLEFGLFSTIIAIICACACWALFVVTLTNAVHLIYIYIYIWEGTGRMV